MIPVANALEIIDRETVQLGSEKADLADSVGRILAQDIIADTDLPAFDRSQMDGFAVVAADTSAGSTQLKIVGESAAGRGWHKQMKRGEAVRIMTGAPVPVGADAIQKVELTRETSDQTVEITQPTEKGRFIVKKGSEIKKGDLVFKQGEVVTENMIAAFASFGYARVKVGKQPRVAIMSTGSEIVEINRKPGRDQIRNSNSVMLDVLSRRAGGATTIFGIATDDIPALTSQIKAAARGADILVITGGVSVGKYDHTKAVLEALRAEIFFDKVRLKPGKPAVFARLGKTLVFGLPGNPVSAAVTFHLIVRRAIRQMQGATQTGLRRGAAVLGGDARAARERDTYLPARLESNKLGQLIAHPLRWQGSSDFIGFSQADALILLSRGKQAAKGDVAEIFYL